MSGRNRWFFMAMGSVALVCAAAFGAETPGAGADAGKTVVYRDTWGIPHIYAATEEAGLYAMGWAQAEDRPEELLKNFLRALGESARFDGEDGVRSDMVNLLFDHYGVAQRRFAELKPDVQTYLRAYARGINDWYAKHPEDVPEWWGTRKIDEFMVVAFGRMFLYSWSIDDAFDDLQRAGVEPGFDETERASNEWSVAPARSAEHAAILLIDPHLSWWGPSRFWEFRIHAGKLIGCGTTLAGFPYIGLGHNENVAWAMTTGGPDTADVYELTLNPGNAMQYRYDDAWRDFKPREVTLYIKGVEPKKVTLLDSHYGPVVALRGGKAYAAKTSYAECVRGAEAWYEFNFAQDYTGVMAGLATLELFPQNVMVADTSGNIYYQRTGRVPIRAEGPDWTRPVDGSVSANEWKGFHPASDHVQILNPPQGYMQNCNIAPRAMIQKNPLNLDAVPMYLVMDKSTNLNPRGARALELLSADDSVTAEEARAYALDVNPFGVERWIAMLKHADEKFGLGGADPDYTAAIAELLAWNGELRRDSTAALKYYYWRRQLIDDYGEEAVGSAARRIDAMSSALGEAVPEIDLNDEELEAAVTALAAAMVRLRADFGRFDAVYGDVFRVGRDEVSWPVGGGGDSQFGLTTLRNVKYSEERPDHTRWGRSGQTCPQIVVLSKPVKSWSALPVGQSDRPDSPHYRDQAEKVFGPRILKPTWWLPNELAEHIESRTVLEKN